MTAERLQALAQSHHQTREVLLLPRYELLHLRRLCRLGDQLTAAGSRVSFERLLQLDRLASMTTGELRAAGQKRCE